MTPVEIGPTTIIQFALGHETYRNIMTGAEWARWLRLRDRRPGARHLWQIRSVWQEDVGRRLWFVSHWDYPGEWSPKSQWTSWVEAVDWLMTFGPGWDVIRPEWLR